MATLALLRVTRVTEVSACLLASVAASRLLSTFLLASLSTRVAEAVATVTDWRLVCTPRHTFCTVVAAAASFLGAPERLLASSAGSTCTSTSLLLLFGEAPMRALSQVVQLGET